MKEKILREIISVGKLLADYGVVDYFSGNLSIKWNGRIFITRSGSPLPLLTKHDIIEISPNKPLVGKPSSEFIVHKRIYETFDGKEEGVSISHSAHRILPAKPVAQSATRNFQKKKTITGVAHAHPPYLLKAITFHNKFLEKGLFIPEDNEGRIIFPWGVPILKLKKPSASLELAEEVAKRILKFPCVIIYSHGVFCAAESLYIAGALILALESSAKLIVD